MVFKASTPINSEIWLQLHSKQFRDIRRLIVDRNSFYPTREAIVDQIFNSSLGRSPLDPGPLQELQFILKCCFDRGIKKEK